MRQRIPLDAYDERPREMRTYLANNGWNFNKKACDMAVSGMRRKNPATGKLEKIEPYNKEQVEDLLNKYGVKLENNVGYNFVYVCNMGRADYLKSSITDEAHLALYVKDVIDDPDNEGGNVFRKWYADCIANEEIVDWDEIL